MKLCSKNDFTVRRFFRLSTWFPFALATHYGVEYQTVRDATRVFFLSQRNGSNTGVSIFKTSKSLFEVYANTWESCATRNWHSTPSLVRLIK